MNRICLNAEQSELSFSNERIAMWYFKKMGCKYCYSVLDDESIIKKYYQETLPKQKQELLNLLKERPEETKKMIDEVLDEMYKRK